MNTLNSFREYLDSHPPKTIIFYSDNQDPCEQRDDANLRLSFSDVVIGERPNVIRMSDGTNSMTLYQVKYVEIDDQTSQIGTILRVVCGHDNCDHRYTIVLR